MEKEKIENTVTIVADDVVLALHAEGATDFVDGNQQKKQNETIRNDLDGYKVKSKKMRKVNSCSLLENDLVFQLPVNSCLKEDSEVNCTAPSASLSRDKSEAEKQHEKHDPAENIEICEDLEATCGTPFSNAGNICSAADSDWKPASEISSTNTSLIVTREDHAVVANSIESDILFTCEPRKPISIYYRRRKIISEAPGVNSESIPDTRSLPVAPNRMEKPSLVQLLEEPLSSCSDHVHQMDLEATCSTPCSNAGNICSAADSDGKPVSEINSTNTSFIETFDNHAVVSNSIESDILFTFEPRKSISIYYRRRKIVSEVPAVNSESIPDTRSLPLVPDRTKKPSLVQSVEEPPFSCSDIAHQKEFDEADVKIPSLLVLCASRDEITYNNDMELLKQEGSLAGNSPKKLLVLDINGLLADVVYDVLEGYTPDAVISGRSVFKRPFCDDFLEFCFAQFNVGVWSSRMGRNVELILDFLMRNAKHKLLFCWDQSHCTNSNRATVENRKKPLLVKKLKKLWEKYEPGLPWELGEYNESNTLLLDDSPHKALCNPPYTAVFPMTYRYKDIEDNSIGPGGELRMYLEGLAMAENVQRYVKENPFGQRPITDKNPSWRYYLDVIRACSSPEHSPIRPSFHW